MFYSLNVCCVYSLELPHMSTHSIHLQDKKKITLNYPYIVFGGNPCRLENMFDSSMVNKPSGFEPLKFYCIWLWHKLSSWIDASLNLLIIIILSQKFEKPFASCLWLLDDGSRIIVAEWNKIPTLIRDSASSNLGLHCLFKPLSRNS